MAFWESLKEKREKEKKYKELEKKYFQEIDEEEKQLEKELKAKKDFLGIKDFIETIKEYEEENELLEPVTEGQRDDFEYRQKAEKKLHITVITVFSCLFVFIVLGSIFLIQFIKSDLEKVTRPLMEEYYFNKYDKQIKIEDIKYLTYFDKNRREKNSNIQIATLEDGNNIVAIDDHLFGDTIDNGDIYAAYDSYLESLDPNSNLISSSPLLSYKDYYVEFNAFYPHIDALPSVYTFEDLLKRKKLTVVDIIMYQGDINYNAFLNFQNKLSEDSVFYLIKNNAGIPINLTVLKKGKITSIDVVNTMKVTEDITYYNLDSSKNSVKSFHINSVKSSLIKSLDSKYKIINGHKITFDSYFGQDKKLSTYFFVSLDESLLELDNVTMFSVSSYGSSYNQLQISDFPSIYMAKVGGSIYILGTEEVGIGNITLNEDNFLCKVGLC